MKITIYIPIPTPSGVMVTLRAVTTYIKIMVFGPEGEHVTDTVLPPLPTDEEDDYDYDYDYDCD